MSSTWWMVIAGVIFLVLFIWMIAAANKEAKAGGFSGNK